jgi:hypothetical protein
MDPASTDLRSIWKTYIESVEATAHFDAIFADDSNDVYGISSMPCTYSATTWLDSTISEDGSTLAPIIYNGLALLGPGDSVSPSIALNATAVGGMAEQCYARGGASSKPGSVLWEAMEDTELQMAAQHKYFVCLGNDYTSSSSAYNARLYEYASFLMSYDPNTTLLWEDYTTTSKVGIEPESQLVALHPRIAAPSSIGALKVGTGYVFAREYGACYLAGKYVGPCATVVNSDYYYSHPFPYTKYHHSLVLSGGGILDGGTVRTNGATPTTMPPLSAAIAFP